MKEAIVELTLINDYDDGEHIGKIIEVVCPINDGQDVARSIAEYLTDHCELNTEDMWAVTNITLY